jgi:hypothetical protein
VGHNVHTIERVRVHFQPKGTQNSDVPAKDFLPCKKYPQTLAQTGTGMLHDESEQQHLRHKTLA